MPIISKETWDKFTQEEKEKINGHYKWLNNLPGDDSNCAGILILEYLFGKEQLQPQPLTYEDVARELFSEDNGNAVFYFDQYGEILDSNVGLADNLTNNPTNCTSRKQAEKLLAINKLLNVARFLNGKDWKPNWENMTPDDYVWSLGIDENKIRAYYVKRCDGTRAEIVFFRTVALANKAVAILGEDVIRLALTTEY